MSRYVTARDSVFTRPSPALVLQVTNTGVRRPGYEATQTPHNTYTHSTHAHTQHPPTHPHTHTPTHTIPILTVHTHNNVTP